MNIADFKQDPQVFHFFKLECSLKVFLHMKRTYYFSRKTGSSKNRENVLFTTRKHVQEFCLLNYLNHLIADIFKIFYGHVFSHWTQSFSLGRQHKTVPREQNSEPGDPISTTKQYMPHSPAVPSFVKQQEILALLECCWED